VSNGSGLSDFFVIDGISHDITGKSRTTPKRYAREARRTLLWPRRDTLNSPKEMVQPVILNIINARIL